MTVLVQEEESLTPDQRYIKVENEESGFSWKRSYLVGQAVTDQNL
jgi:hypothetical protein